MEDEDGTTGGGVLDSSRTVDIARPVRECRLRVGWGLDVLMGCVDGELMRGEDEARMGRADWVEMVWDGLWKRRWQSFQKIPAVSSS